MPKPYLIVLVLVSLLALSAAAFFAQERNRILLRGSGVRADEVVLGVSIGASRGQAIAELTSRGYQHYETTSGGKCLYRSYDADVQLDVFRDRSWRRGTICVASQGRRIKEIQWWFNPLSP